MEFSNMIIDYVRQVSDTPNVTHEDIAEFIREYEDYLNRKENTEFKN